MSDLRDDLIIVKIGSKAIELGKGRELSEKLNDLVKQVCLLNNKGWKVVIVSSGAVDAGRRWSSRLDRRGPGPNHNDLMSKQALAAVGQPILMAAWKKAFGGYEAQCAQLLVTPGQCRFVGASCEELLENHIVPVINGNDPATSAELNNDDVALQVAEATHARFLVFLTDRPVTDMRPNGSGERIKKLTGDLRGCSELYGPIEKGGCGGMKHKVGVSHKAADLGMVVMIAPVTVKDVLVREFTLGLLDYGSYSDEVTTVTS